MGDKTGIEWTDSTWNPIRARNLKTGKLGWHCEHASEACRWCYAEQRNTNTFFGNGLAYKPGHRKDIEIFLDEQMLLKPLHWRKPRKIFPCSMTDIGASFVTDEMLDSMFAVMAMSGQHTFQVLTKRPERMREWFEGARRAKVIAQMYASGATFAAIPWPLPNVWLGSSCEDQATADERIPHLLATPAAIHFLSCEPLLGPIDLGHLPSASGIGRHLDALGNAGVDPGALVPHKIDWVICGGESGPNARPMHPDWARALRDDCDNAGVPFHFKQWGEWAPGENADLSAARSERTASWNGKHWDLGMLTPTQSQETHRDDEPDLFRIGKKRAGRKLDGVEHNAFPEAHDGR